MAAEQRETQCMRRGATVPMDVNNSRSCAFSERGYELLDHADGSPDVRSLDGGSERGEPWPWPLSGSHSAATNIRYTALLCISNPGGSADLQ